MAQDVKAGQKIIVPDFTFVATASIPAILGCEIDVVDADLQTFNALENYEIPSKKPARLMIDTDVAGLPSANKYEPANMFIEDAAEALGSETALGKTGAKDHLTCFSFNITKSLSTVEGGAVASKNEELIEKVRSISNYGRTKEQYVHDRLGLNCRITDMQSALGLIQLRKLDKNLARRKEIADRYRKELPQFQFQKVPSYVTKPSNYWMIALTDNRNKWIAKFQNAGIDARQTFLPISRQPCFPGLPFCPNAYKIYLEGLTLPIFASMTNEQVEYIIATANS